MPGMMDYFKSILLIMLFYSFCITMLTYSIPDEAKTYVTVFSDVANELDFDTVTGQVQDSLQRQTQIPVIELGALVFYTGNIIIDLLLNFAFALPQMVGLLVNGLMILFNIDSQLFAIVQLFASALLMILYFIGIMELLSKIRSPGSIV